MTLIVMITQRALSVTLLAVFVVSTSTTAQQVQFQQ